MRPEKYFSMLFYHKLHSFQGLFNFSHFHSVNKLLSASCDICLFSITDTRSLVLFIQICHGGGGNLLHRAGQAEGAGLEDVQGGRAEEPDRWSH